MTPLLNASSRLPARIVKRMLIPSMDAVPSRYYTQKPGTSILRWITAETAGRPTVDLTWLGLIRTIPCLLFCSADEMAFQ
jgi:hypothetical protein